MGIAKYKSLEKICCICKAYCRITKILYYDDVIPINCIDDCDTAELECNNRERAFIYVNSVVYNLNLEYALY